MDINVSVRAVEKLIDYTASGIGSTASFFFSRMVARRDAEVRLISAKGEARAQKALAESQANTMQIISKAQADARSNLISSDAVVEGEVTFGDLVDHRIRFQEQKRQSNIESVVRQAALELGDQEVQDHEPDHDWTARFFNEVQDVSSEKMQQLWAKILAGEVERPGSTSVKTLGILKNLDRATATLFGKLCSVCISSSPDGINFDDARVPFLGDYSEGNALRGYGLDFRNLNVLSEHGLINPEYNTWHDYRSSTGLDLPHSQTVHIPFCFQGKHWVLVSTRPREPGQEFRLSGVSLTKSGRELSRVVDLEPVEQYRLALIKYFEQKNFQMVEVASRQPQVFSNSSP